MALALVAMVAASSTSALPPVGQHNNGFSKTDERYLHTYVDCWHAFKADCGRNIVDDGLSSGKAPSDGRVETSTERMQGWLHPEPAPVPASSSTEGVAVPTPVETSVPAAPVSTGGCPASMAAESGSAGYSAYNPSSGATGCYQILPSTAASLGCDLSTPAGQDACAQEICATSGNGAWSASGATPCG